LPLSTLTEELKNLEDAITDDDESYDPEEDDEEVDDNDGNLNFCSMIINSFKKQCRCWKCETRSV
jgi:hypothetical protein